MRRHDGGPRRSGSAGSYLRETRLPAALAVAGLVAGGLVAGVMSDAIGVPFWRVSDEIVGRWAAVVLNADAYAEIIDLCAVTDRPVVVRSRGRPPPAEIPDEVLPG